MAGTLRFDSVRIIVARWKLGGSWGMYTTPFLTSVPEIYSGIQQSVWSKKLLRNVYKALCKYPYEIRLEKAAYKQVDNVWPHGMKRVKALVIHLDYDVHKPEFHLLLWLKDIIDPMVLNHLEDPWEKYMGPDFRQWFCDILEDQWWANRVSERLNKMKKLTKGSRHE